MLLWFILVSSLSSAAICSEGQPPKPYIFPIPFELPNRNDRSEQCWVRVEDVDIIETVTVYCYMAQQFLRIFVPEYNTRKIMEDDVDVSLWSEEPRTQEKLQVPKPSESNGKVLLNWKVTTLMDTTTHLRLYISQKADCKLVIYSREGMTNYNVDCPTLLYFFNERMSGFSTNISANISLLVVINLLLFLVNQ